MINNFNDHAANERTFLAWVRTAMALVGFGLVVAHLRDETIDLISQAALVVMGCLVVLIAWIRMHSFTRRIEGSETNSYSAGLHSKLFIASVVSLLALAGVFVWNII